MLADAKCTAVGVATAGVVRVLVLTVVNTLAATGTAVDSRVVTASGPIAAVREDVETDSDSVVLRDFLLDFGCIAAGECRLDFISCFLCDSSNSF